MATIHTTYETARAELEAMKNPTIAQLRDTASDGQKNRDKSKPLKPRYLGK
jgi:hypothetical protein